MQTQPNRDLIISGSGSAAGGSFHRVRINGSGEINGDIECIDLKVNGSCRMNANIKADTVSIHGSTDMTGNLLSDLVKIHGNMEIEGDLTAKDVKIHGNCNVTGNLSSDKIAIHGGSGIGGDCAAETFLAEGGFSIGGLLNAGEINIKLYGGCRVKEIGGEKITVKKPGIANKLKRLIFSFFGVNVDLEAGIIEGDEIYLEHTNAKVVRGNNVIIGAGCQIELVEYKNEFQALKGAIVRDKKQM